MRFCKYCGVQITENQTICESCRIKKMDQPVSNVSGTEKSKAYTKWIVIAVVSVIVVILLLSTIGKCKADGCNNKSVSGSKYCYSHKCAINGCSNKRYYLSNYCYTHYSIYDDDAAKKSNPVYSWDLPISNVTLSSNSSYTIAEGSLTNLSDSTVRFVEIKGAFKDRNGVVVDTDWTYAVGSEGLAPGESCKWRMSVSKDSRITKCETSILDFDY